MQPDASLTATQVAAILGISKRKLDYLVASGDAPNFYRIGRLRRWRPTDVEVWMSQRGVRTAPLNSEGGPK
jgi:excisionase family DNA binding protein